MGKMTPALQKRLPKVLDMMLEVYNSTKNGYVNAASIFNQFIDGKIRQIGSKYALNTEYNKVQFAGAGYLEINPLNSKEVRWIKGTPTAYDAKYLYEYNSVSKSLKRSAENPEQPRKRTRRVLTNVIPVKVVETQSKPTEVKFSKPKRSTIEERLGYLQILAFNSRNGYVAKDKAFLMMKEDPTSHKTKMVDALVENHVDLKFSVNFLATTKFVDKNAAGNYKWIGATPTYKIAEEICTRLNREKAQPLTKRKKTVVVVEPVAEVVKEVVTEAVVDVLKATPVANEPKTDFRQIVIEATTDEPLVVDYSKMTDRDILISTDKRMANVEKMVASMLEIQKKDTNNFYKFSQIFEKALK